MNLTEADSRIMPIPGGGFRSSVQCARAAVDVETMLVVEHTKWSRTLVPAATPTILRWRSGSTPLCHSMKMPARSSA